MIDVCNIHEVKSLLARHGFHFSKAKGQNFLVQSWIPQETAEADGIDETCGVLEVGPGIGTLTQALCRRAGKVVAVEVDASLAPLLEETMADFDNWELVSGDILKQDIPALVREKFPGLTPVACANLPYYITTPVLAALLQSRQFSSVTVMVQKEVAQRICAKAGTPDYGAFTVFCQYYAQPELLFTVPPDCFLPQPKVTSAVLRLTCRPAPPCEILDEDTFFRAVRASFAQRRKTLVNGLCAGFSAFSKAELADVLAACGYGASIRGETLDIAGFAAVANELYRRQRHG